MTAVTKFAWERDIPTTPFWSSVEDKVAQSFIPCFTEEELMKLPLDAALTETEKLKLLKSILDSSLAQKDQELSPLTLHAVDYPLWQRVTYAISMVEHYMKDTSAEEATLRGMLNNGPGGSRNMMAAFSLAWLVEGNGDHGEAERLAREVLPWIQGHEALGNDSPQAFGIRRLLITTLYKQGQMENARALVKECEALLAKMDQSIFAKYKGAEVEELEVVKRAMADWKA